jgi:hypothetical protein
MEKASGGVTRAKRSALVGTERARTGKIAKLGASTTAMPGLCVTNRRNVQGWIMPGSQFEKPHRSGKCGAARIKPKYEVQSL